MQKRLLEIACFNPGSAMIAQTAGADRIEFCSNYWEGGITPPEREIEEVRDRMRIPVHVMIRCRGGDFTFSTSELVEMRDSVIYCRQKKVQGIVIGVLDENNAVDIEACKMLMEEAGRMEVIFHRAIDLCANIERGIEDLISLGIKRVLSSGGEPNVLQGLPTLKRLQQKYGKDITIIAGGGLRSTNIHQALQSGCKEFHSSALTNMSVTVDPNEIRRLKKHV